MKNTYIATRPLITIWVLMLAIAQGTLAQTFCTESGTERFAGVENGFRYELWNQNGQGNACMTLGDGALFSGEWSEILNYLARRGLDYNQTQEHEEIGRFFADFDCDYNPSSASGNSYLSIYGWTVDPLIEFYIVEDWRNWIPSMASGSVNRGTFEVNGSVYDVIENTRTNQPSIVGTATFQQYFSIRRDERNSGSINISDHFDHWESLGLELGKLHEVSFVVEGYQSNGNFNFTDLDVYLGEKDTNTLDIEDSELGFTIFPNPNKGTISIQVKEPLVDASVKIYDTSGKMVFAQNDLQEKIIKVSDLVSGFYYITLTNNGISQKTKLLVE